MSDYFVSVDAIALAAATAKSVLELATDTNVRITIREWWVDFDGVSGANSPVKVEVGRFSAAVTTATSITPEKMSPGDAASGVTAKHSTSTEGAGTADDVIIRRITPTGWFHYIAPEGHEMRMEVSTFWRMRLTAAQVVNATVGVLWSTGG